MAPLAHDSLIAVLGSVIPIDIEAEFTIISI
jgi:hypothetical protein